MSNADLIERLRAEPNRPTVNMPLGNGTHTTTFGLGHSSEDDELRKLAADALEAADKRIAELEADIHSTHARAMQNGKAVQEAESKLAVAREALALISDEGIGQCRDDAREALAQIEEIRSEGK